MDQHQDNAPAAVADINATAATLEQMTANEMQAATRASKRRPGRPRGARSSDTVALLARLRQYEDAGIDLLDGLIAISEDRSQAWGVRLAAMRHVCGAMLGRIGGPPA
jgi:hypothetical protein